MIESANFAKPVIRPAVKFLVFQKGYTFNLKCEIGAGWNITWQIPPSKEKKNSTSFINWTQNLSNNQVYATLTVETADYLDTGYYTCIRMSSKNDANNRTMFAKQFIFIPGFTIIITSISYN